MLLRQRSISQNLLYGSIPEVGKSPDAPVLDHNFSQEIFSMFSMKYDPEETLNSLFSYVGSVFYRFLSRVSIMFIVESHGIASF